MYSPFVQPRGLRVGGPVMAPSPVQQQQPQHLQHQPQQPQLTRAPSRTAPPGAGGRLAMPNSPRVDVSSYRPIQMQRSGTVAAWSPQQSQHAASASDVVRLPSSPQSSPVTQYRTTRKRLSEPPQTPSTDKWEVNAARWMPSTPQATYRSSPPTQFRAVPLANSPPAIGGKPSVLCSPVQGTRIITAGAMQQMPPQMYAERQRAVSRVVRSTSKGRGIGNVAYPASVQAPMPSASPMSYQGRPLRVAGPALVASDQVPEVRRRAPANIDDAAVQKTAAMLPPSPCNTLPDFLVGVVSGDIKPAMCQRPPQIFGEDLQRYWEKRRVQNSLRRVLETLQERFSMDGIASSADLGLLAHDEIALWAQRSNLGKALDLLDEDTFQMGMEALAAWPPELTPSDRSEVFAALRAPTIAVVLGLSTGGHLEKELSRRRFGEGMARVPFNLPDFPVPTHLLEDPGSSRGANEVAAAIASAFCLPGGLESVNDFFLCGLLSLEEIQITLPFLASASIMEEAITKIIRAGTDHFTQREWQELVINQRLLPQEPELAQEVYSEPQVQQGQSEQLPISLASPEVQHREMSAPGPALGNELQEPFWSDPMGFTSESNKSLVAHLPIAEEFVQRDPKLTPRTEPLPTREVRSEAPVQFALGHHVINWNATRRPVDADACLIKPADKVSDGHEKNSQEQQESMSSAAHGLNSSREAEKVNDPVHWISLSMHNECAGPFLAIAFVRCCQLYDVRRSRGSLSG